MTELPMGRRVRREHEQQVRAERGPVPAPGAEEPLQRAVAIQRTAGNQAFVRMLARTKTKKIGSVKVEYAVSSQEAVELCRAECERHDMNWDTDISAAAKETILRYAQTPSVDEVPAGLPGAYDLILSEKREATLREERRLRREEMAADDSDYSVLLPLVEGDDILEACLRWMKDEYVAGVKTKTNHTLGSTYTRAEVASAVADWRRIDRGVSLKVMSNPHGYPVGPKNPNVGDTLDRRGDQGNIIALWKGAKINIHINPSD
jgi:hypothetical protein